MKKLIAGAVLVSAGLGLSACGDSLPKVCETYIAETESLVKNLPAEMREKLEPELKGELEQMRAEIKKLNTAQQETECKKALDMLSMIKNMMPK